MSLVDYQRLKEKAEKARRQADQAAGALKQQYQELQRDFGCSDLSEATAMLEQLSREEKALRDEIETKVEELERIHPELF